MQIGRVMRKRKLPKAKYWLVAGIVMALACVVIYGYSVNAFSRGTVIFDVQSLEVADHGGLRMRNEYRVVGPNVALEVGRRIEGEEYIYSRHGTGGIWGALLDPWAVARGGFEEGGNDFCTVAHSTETWR